MEHVQPCVRERGEGRRECLPRSFNIESEYITRHEQQKQNVKEANSKEYLIQNLLYVI